MTELRGVTGPACREVRQLLGVYVVGAIDPAERSIVDYHLEYCQSCREELSGLAGLPALLGRVPLADAERLAEGGYGLPEMYEPSAELLNGLLARVAARRRGRRLRSILALAAAVAIAAGGTATAIEALRPAVPSGSVPTDVAQSSNAVFTAMVRYSATPWGISMRIGVTGIPPGTHCRFWVVGAGGHRFLAAAWTIGQGYGEHWYSVSSAVAEKQVSASRSPRMAGPCSTFPRLSCNKAWVTAVPSAAVRLAGMPGRRAVLNAS